MAGNVTALAQLAGFAFRAAPAFFNQVQAQRKRPVEPAPFIPAPHLWPDSGLHAAWLGHSTVLLKVDGFTILTDPILSRNCGVRVGRVTVGMKRLIEPALDFKQLPKIDLILLSHAHFDHFDLPTLRRLEGRGTAVITATSTSDLLRVKRYQTVKELGWGARSRVGPVEVTGLEVRHWGARMRTDKHRGYNAYLIEAGGRRVLFGGDTAFTRNFRAVPAVDLAIMPIGAYDPWIAAHCNPEEAWQMAQDCQARCVLPVHHQTFRLGREGYFEPIERLQEVAGRDADRIVVKRIGQQWTLGSP
jgi:L-ascorbate metabolism protein UlaG (beta-lactamase superfamily)